MSVILLLYPLLLAGCWNYREIDELAVVAGVAVDKGTEGKLRVTVEVVEPGGGKDIKPKSKLISMEGNTIFEAARNEIAVSGRRLYWSHAKVVIISEEIARQGATQVLDWYNRDAETRADIHILVSRGAPAGEIFTGQSEKEEVRSFNIDDMLANQKSLSKAPQTQIWEFTNHISDTGVDAVVPVVTLKQMDGKIIPFMYGSGLFKEDKLVGFLDGEETKYMLFVKDQVRGGVLVVGKTGEEKGVQVSLEIFGSGTKTKPVVDDRSIEFQVETETEVAIDEIAGSDDVIEEEGRLELERSAETMLKQRMNAVIRKTQKEFGIDVFGFGVKLREEHPQVWKRYEADWDTVFRDVEVHTSAKVHIRNSAMLSKTIKVGE